MPRMLTYLVGISGLAIAAYLVFFQRVQMPAGFETPIADGKLFGVAIAIVSTLLLGTTRSQVRATS